MEGSAHEYFYHIQFCQRMIQFPYPMGKQSNSHNPQAHSLYNASQLEQKNVPSLRTAFNHWIRSLPMEQRFLALKIYSAPIPQILRKILSQIQDVEGQRGSEIRQVQQQVPIKKEVINDLKRISRKIQKTFSESLVFISDGHDYMDHICFQFGLLQCPQKLFDLLVSPINNLQTKLIRQIIQNHQQPQKIIQKLMICQNLQELAVTTLTYLRQEIFLRFRAAMMHHDFLTRSLEDQRRRKKEFSIYLKHLSQDLKKKMVLIGFNTIMELHQWLVSYQINIEYEELQKEVEQLLKLEKNQFSNRIFKCKFKKLTSKIIYYYEQIYFYWKREVGKNKKKKFSRSNIYNEKMQHYQNTFNFVEETQPRVNNIQRSKTKNKKSLSLESNQTNVTDATDGGKKILKRKNGGDSDSPQSHLDPKIQQKKDSSNSKQRLDTSFIQTCEKRKLLQKRKLKQQKNEPKPQKKTTPKKVKINESQFPPASSLSNSQLKGQLKMCLNSQNVKDISISIITQELQQFVDKISQESLFCHDRRMIAFERIQFLLSYSYIQIQLFGSCANGIATKHSDIDIAVKQQVLGYFQHLPEHLRLQAALKYLSEIFQTQSYISEINMITTASTPIIKLKVNTSITCLNSQYGQIYQRLNRPHNCGFVEVDVTIKTPNLQPNTQPFGITSTHIINDWLRKIPTLNSIVLAVKQLLQNRELHKTYEGGINTFTILIMIVAYVYHAKLQKQTNPAVIFQLFLKFYAYQFDQKQTGIDLLDQKCIFYNKLEKNVKDIGPKGRQKADLEILDPQNSSRNITRRSYMYPKIKDFFKEIVSNCFEKTSQDLYERVKNLKYINTAKELKPKQNRFSLLLHKK